MITITETKLLNEIVDVKYYDVTKEQLAEFVYTNWSKYSHAALSQKLQFRGLLLEDCQFLIDYLEEHGVSSVYKITLIGTNFPKENIRSSTYHLDIFIGMKYNENIENIIQNF